jgi:hypothetical protein
LGDAVIDFPRALAATTLSLNVAFGSAGAGKLIRNADGVLGAHKASISAITASTSREWSAGRSLRPFMPTSSANAYRNSRASSVSGSMQLGATSVRLGVIAAPITVASPSSSPSKSETDVGLSRQADALGT